MKKVIIILTLCAGIHLNASAQSFTQRIQQKTPGMGSVSVHQSQEIDQLVNSAQLAAAKNTTASSSAKPTVHPATKPADSPASSSASSPSSSASSSSASTPDAGAAPVDNTKKMARGGYKVNGYRVQAYAGGNSRKDRLQAEQVGNQIKASFPEEPVYVHFYSPRWICRVGNYRTYEEAHQMLVSMRKLGFTEATIVKGKITVFD